MAANFILSNYECHHKALQLELCVKIPNCTESEELFRAMDMIHVESFLKYCYNLPNVTTMTC